MKALLYKDRSGPTLVEIVAPTPGPGEAIVAVDACGVCGTDLMKLETGAAPSVLGHELAGRIAALGPGVSGWSLGERVVVAHHVPCEDCHYCRRGHPSMCRQFKATNIEPGGFSELVRVSALHVRHTMLRIPGGLDAIAASQTEPLACCLRNARRLALRAGDSAVIVGLGAVGLLSAQLLSRLGVAVLGLDLDEARAAALSPWGEGFTAIEAIAQAIGRRSAGRGADAAILTAGNVGLAARLLTLLRDGGTLNVFASFHPPLLPLDLNAVYHRELTVLSSYSPAASDLREALKLIADGEISIAALRPRAFALGEFDTARRALRAREVLKAVIVPAAVEARS